MNILIVLIIGLIVSRISQFLMEYLLYKKKIIDGIEKREVTWKRMFSIGYSNMKERILYLYFSDLIAVLGILHIITLIDNFGIKFGLVGLVLLLILLFTWITDTREMLILNIYTYPGFLLLTIGVIWLAPIYVPWVHLLGGLGIGGLFFLLFIVTKGKMGFGDVKLVTVLGMYFGFFDMIVIMTIASVLGLVIGLILLKVNKGESKPFPFGPFIVLGSLIVWLSGFNIFFNFL